MLAVVLPTQGREVNQLCTRALIRAQPFHKLDTNMNSVPRQQASTTWPSATNDWLPRSCVEAWDHDVRRPSILNANAKATVVHATTGRTRTVLRHAHLLHRPSKARPPAQPKTADVASKAGVLPVSLFEIAIPQCTRTCSVLRPFLARVLGALHATSANWLPTHQHAATRHRTWASFVRRSAVRPSPSVWDNSALVSARGPYATQAQQARSSSGSQTNVTFATTQDQPSCQKRTSSARSPLESPLWWAELRGLRPQGRTEKKQQHWLWASCHRSTLAPTSATSKESSCELSRLRARAT